MNLPTHALTCSTLPNWYKRNPLFPKYSPLISKKHYILNAWVISRERMRELRWRKEISRRDEWWRVIEGCRRQKSRKWQMRRATRNCWKLWNVSSHHSSNLSFRPWGHLNVGRKMWWQDNRLQHPWKNSANLHKMIMTVLKSFGS